MEITTRAVGFVLSDQGRAYVEYRMFSAISRFGGRNARLGVRLEARGVGVGFRCVADLSLDAATHVQVRARADRLYAAIDRGAERLARAVKHRFSEPREMVAERSGAAGPMTPLPRNEGRRL